MCVWINDSLEKKIRSEIIYHYMCNNCKVTYYGKTFRHFYVRITEFMGISNLTGKVLKNLVMFDHPLQCNCTINFDDFDILTANSNKFKLLLKEFSNKAWQTYLINRTIKSLLPCQRSLIKMTPLFPLSNNCPTFLINSCDFIVFTNRARICLNRLS